MITITQIVWHGDDQAEGTVRLTCDRCPAALGRRALLALRDHRRRLEFVRVVDRIREVAEGEQDAFADEVAPQRSGEANRRGRARSRWIHLP